MADNDQFRKELTQELGYRSVPVILVDGQAVVGFNKNQLEKLLH